MARTEIAAEASLDTTKFQRGLAKADKGVKGFAKNALRSFGALAGAAGLGSMATAAINLGSKISDMAVQLNIGTTELQTLEFAAREAGVEVSVMERALRNVQLRTQEAINGNKTYAAAFERLGLNIEKFNELPTEAKLESVAIAQKNAKDQAAAYNDVAIILGQRAGPAMQEILQNLAGPEGFKGLEDAAKSSGEVMSKETIAKMDAAADKIESFKRKVTVMTGELLTRVIPAFRLLGDGLGFVGETIGAGILNMKAFFTFLASSLSEVIEPAIKQFKALGKGIESAVLAAKGEFGAAKAAIDESIDGMKESFDELISIPGDIGENFKEMTKDIGENFSDLGDDLEARSKAISESWSEMTGSMVKDAKDASREIEKEAPAVAGTFQEPKTNEEIKAEAKKKSKATTFQGQTLEQAMADARKQGIRFQRFRGKGGAEMFQRFENGRKTGGLMTREALEKAAARRPQQKDPVATQQDMAKSLKMIERELTSTQAQ